MDQRDESGLVAASPASAEFSSPPESSRHTPESSGEENGIRHEGEKEEETEEEGEMDGEAIPADPLLRTAGGEVYELREGTRKKRPGRWHLEDDYHHGARGDDDADEEDEEEEEDGEAIVYTAEEERGVVRKFDRRLVLFVALLYLLSFLDRSSMSGFLSSFFLLASLVSHSSVSSLVFSFHFLLTTCRNGSLIAYARLNG